MQIGWHNQLKINKVYRVFPKDSCNNFKQIILSLSAHLNFVTREQISKVVSRGAKDMQLVLDVVCYLNLTPTQLFCISLNLILIVPQVRMRQSFFILCGVTVTNFSSFVHFSCLFSDLVSVGPFFQRLNICLFVAFPI